MRCDLIFPWFQFGFALSFGSLMYDNEFEKKENKILIKKKMNYNIQ